MENGSRKAHETAFGASVIASQPLAGPPIIGGPTLSPGSPQLCGPCKAKAEAAVAGFVAPCPIHDGHGAAGSSAYIGGAQPLSPTDKLTALVAGFLDDVVEHVVDRVTASVRNELTLQREIESMPPEYFTQTFGGEPRSFVETRLRELARALDEHHIEAFVAKSKIANGPLLGMDVQVPILMVEWIPGSGKYVAVATIDGARFTMSKGRSVAEYDFNQIVDMFATAREDEPK